MREVLSTLADIDGHATRPGARTSIDLIAAGWRERWRTRPPLWRWFAYRYAGRLPERWHPWLLDDIHGWFGLRQFLFSVLAGFVPGLVIMTVTGSRLLPVFAGAFGGFVVVFLPFARRWARWYRRKVLVRNGYDPISLDPRPPWTAPPWAYQPRPPTIVRAWPALVMVGSALIVAFPVGVLAFLYPDVLPRSLGTTTFSIGRDPLDGQTAMGVACICVAAVAAAVSVAFAPRVVSAMSRRTAAEGTAVVSGWLLAFGSAAVVLGVAIAGLIRILPMLLPAVVLAAGGVGPTLLAIGFAIRARERRFGSPIALLPPSRTAPTFDEVPRPPSGA